MGHGEGREREVENRVGHRGGGRGEGGLINTNFSNREFSLIQTYFRS